MKRALAVVVALCTLGFAGFSQIVIKGSWTASVCLPDIELTSTLSLTFTVAGFDITSTTTFDEAGITGQGFSLKGAFGPFSLTGKMRFDPEDVAYEVGQLVTSFDFAGLALGLTVNHWLDGEWDPVYFGYPTLTPDPCDPTIVGGNLQYVLTAKIDPWSVRVRFLDCSAGTAFQDLLVTGAFDLCCGIKLNSSFSFTKAGFGSLVLSGINIPLCCGVSLDVSITYSEDSKSVTITPKFAGIAEACFTVYGGPEYSASTNTWSGIRIDGFRIRCSLGDCNYLEYVHAFNPAAATIPYAIRAKFLGDCAEDEYLELGFCGPACCGGKYEVSLRLLWNADATSGVGLFGLTRFVGAVKIPIMTNFTLNLDFVMPAGCPAATASFCFGWTFTF